MRGHPRNPVGLHDRVLGWYRLPRLESPRLDTGTDDRRYLLITGHGRYQVKIIRHMTSLNSLRPAMTTRGDLEHMGCLGGLSRLLLPLHPGQGQDPPTLAGVDQREGQWTRHLTS